MSLKNIISGSREVYGKGRSIGRWAVPVVENLQGGKLDSLVEKIISTDKKVRSVFKRNSENYDGLRRQLEYAILDSYQENYNLKRFAGYIDTADKALVPVDVIADYMKIMGGIGYGLSAGKELIEMPPKLAYLAYYVGNTKDFVGALGDLAYEGLSFFLPGSLLDLTNHYVKKADKYILKNASYKFLDAVKSYEGKAESLDLRLSQSFA